MINVSRDIESLSSFKRQTKRFIRRMKTTGAPMVLTINGRAELVVLDAASYQRLLESADVAKDLEFLRRSLDDVEQGRTKPMRQAIRDLGKP